MGNNHPSVIPYKKSQFVPGSVVLIQGASSGLGTHLAYKYAARGCPMVLTGRNEEALKKIVTDIHSKGNKKVHYITGEATSESDAKKIVDFTIEKFKRIDIAVLSAGVGAHQIFDENADMDLVRKVMDINLMGYLLITKYLVPHLKMTRGQLVVISSISGVVPTPERAAYCASKYAVNGFYNSLHLDIGDKIAITQINPTTIQGTNFRANNLSVKAEAGSGNKQQPSDKGKKELTVEVCADICMDAADRKVRFICVPGKHHVVSYLYPFMPKLIEPIIVKAAKM